jgi:hypothetical protein
VLREQIRELVLALLLYLIHFHQDIDRLFITLCGLHHCNLPIDMVHRLALPLRDHLDTVASNPPVFLKPVLQLRVSFVRLLHLMLFHYEFVYLLETLARDHHLYWGERRHRVLGRDRPSDISCFVNIYVLNVRSVFEQLDEVIV